MRRIRSGVTALTVGGSAIALAFTVPGVAAAQDLPEQCAVSGENVVCHYTYSGEAEAFQVPDGVFGVHLTAIGAKGGGNYGGDGAKISADIPVIPGSLLYANVGGNGETVGSSSSAVGGYNGGGNTGTRMNTSGSGSAGSGGGASDVRLDANNLATRILVAGGGGGQVAGFPEYYGGDAGMPGADAQYAGGGGAGTMAAGGGGGAGGNVTGYPPGVVTPGDDGSPGTFADGGRGGNGSTPGGGAGGGFFGGGGGGGAYHLAGVSSTGGGGGGGSSMSITGTVPEITDEPASVTIVYRQPEPDCLSFCIS